MKILRRLNACGSGAGWAESQVSYRDAWDRCERYAAAAAAAADAAAYAADAADAAAAKNETLKKAADICRKHITFDDLSISEVDDAI